MQNNSVKSISIVAVEQRVLRKLKGTGRRLMRRQTEYFIQDYAQQEEPQHFENVAHLADALKVRKKFELIAPTHDEYAAISHAEEKRKVIDGVANLLQEHINLLNAGFSDAAVQEQLQDRAAKLFERLQALKEMKAA